MAKQGIEILLQTIIFTCMKQMEKCWDRVNWLVSTEKDLLCICWEARHVSIPPTGESRIDVYPVEIMCFALWVTAYVHVHTVEVRAAPALQPRSSPGSADARPPSLLQPRPGSAGDAMLTSLLCPGLWMEQLRCCLRKALAAFLGRGTGPNIAKAEFSTLVAS